MKPLTPQQRKMSSANVKDVDDYFSVRLSLFTVFKGRHGSGVRGRRPLPPGRRRAPSAHDHAASSPPGEEANGANPPNAANEANEANEADSSNAASPANPADAADAANGGDKTALLRKMRRLEKFKYLQRKRKKKHLMSVSADGKERVLPGRRDSKRRVPPVKSKGATARVRAGLTSGVDYKLNRKRREAPDGKDGKYGKYADEEKIPRDEFEAICYLLMDREFYGHPVSIPCGGLDRRGSHSANQRSDDCMNRFNHLGEGLGKPARVKKDARKSCGDRIAEDLAQMVRASDRSGSAAGGKRKTAKREMADRETGEGEPFCEKPVGGNCPSSGGEPPAGAAAKGESSSGGHSDSHSDGHSDHSPTMPRNRKSEAIRNHLHTINRTLSYPIRHSQLSPDTYLFFLIQHREKKHRTFYAYCRVFSRTGVLKQGLQIKKLFHLGRKARIQDIITSALRKKIAYVDDDSCGRGTSHQGIISFLQENCVYRDLLCLYRLPRKGGFPIGGGSLENARSGASPPRSAKRHGQLICPIEGGPPPHRRRSDAFYQSMKRCSRIERYVRSVRKIYFGWGSPVGNYVHAGDHREVKEGNAKGGRHCGLTWGETPIREQQGKHNSCVSFGEANLGEKRKKKIMTSQVKRLRRKVRRYEGELFCAGGRASHECAQPGHPRRPRHPGYPLEECTPKRSRVAATLRRISEMYAQWKTKEERHIAGFLFFHFFFFNKRCVYYGDKRVGGNEVGRNEVGRDEVGRDRVGSDLGESCPSSCPPDERSSWFFNSFDYVGEAGGASSVARAFLKRVKRQRGGAAPQGEAAQYGEEAPRGVSPQNASPQNASPQNASPHNASPPRKEKRRNDIFEHMNRYASRISKNIHLANRSRHDDYPFDFSLQKGEGGWHDSIDTAPAMEEIKTITTILNTPVIKLSEAEKKCLWKFRLQLVNREEALGKFLKSVNWDDQQEKEEATELLNCWSKPCLENCLELLNGHLHRAVIKKYVMQIIEQAKKDQLKLYLFQLVQSLRVFNHEPIDSLFMDTLINKCITSKKLSIFLHWFLLSETKDKCKGNLYIHIHKLFITKLMTSNLRKKKKILSILKNQNRFRNQLLYLTKIAKRKSERIHNKTKKLRQFLFCYRQNYGCVVIKDFIKNNIFLSDSEVYDFASPQPRPGAPPGGGEAGEEAGGEEEGGEVEGEEGGEVEAEEAEAEGETAYPAANLASPANPDVRNSVYYLNGELSIRADPAADAYCFQYEPRGAHFSQGAAPPAQRSTSDVSTEDSKTVNYIDDSRGAPIERNRDTSFFSNLLQLNDNFDFFLSATYSDEDNHIDILDDSISLVRKQKIKKIRAPLILPIDPDIEFLSFLPEQSYVLRSSLYPIVIACLVRKKIKLAHEHFHNLIINEQKYLKKNVKKKKNYSMYHEVNSKFLKSLYSSFDCASDFERHYRKVKWEGKNIFYNGRKVERVGLQNWGPRDGEESAKVAPTEVAPSNAASAEAAPPSAGVVIHHESETNPQSKQRVKKYNEIYELSIKRYIYKAGDDLRQDHLVIQIICIIDNIWKRYGLDLKLTLYKVLALSTDDGFIEFVNYAESISSIKKNYKGEIRQYFIEMSTDSKSPLGFDAIILDNFISSCAGYSVITYLLGIGDRHLDNLMVSRDGCFFHIDFGYIFGEDPKPFSPPMKLCKEMIEAMGGAHSVGYEQFLKKCCLAYKYLRYHSKLIISLLDCMCESGLKDMKMSPELCVLKVQEKFRLDLNDEAAEVYFLSVINASVKTLFPVVVDKLHEWALNWK